MEKVEKFIDSQLVYMEYWPRENRPEVTARMFIESVFYLHHVSNTYHGYVPWSAGINLVSVLKRMIRLYLDDNEFIKMLDGSIAYNEDHMDTIYRLFKYNNVLYMRLIFGCLAKSIIPHKPNIGFIKDTDKFLESASILMCKSRSKKIICSPDSEFDNDQYHACNWIDVMMDTHKSENMYNNMVLLTAVTDIVILSYMQRVTKFKDIYEFTKRLCINDIVTNTHTLTQ